MLREVLAWIAVLAANRIEVISLSAMSTPCPFVGYCGQPAVALSLYWASRFTVAGPIWLSFVCRSTAGGVCGSEEEQPNMMAQRGPRRELNGR